MTSGNCFSKSRRLLNAAAFKTVFDHVDNKASSRELLCLAHKNSLDHPRLGLVIAKKNIRLSVQRNRVKRIIRESFRLHQHQLPSIDLIVMARKGLGEMDNADIHAELDRMWHRLIKKFAKPTPTT